MSASIIKSWLLDKPIVEEKNDEGHAYVPERYLHRLRLGARHAQGAYLRIWDSIAGTLAWAA